MSDYSDIVGLSRPRSRRPPMPLSDRAAQFAPFAALSGHEAAVAEAARFTDERAVLSDDQRDAIDRALALLRERLGSRPAVRIAYFEADGRKDGGAYRTCEGRLARIGEHPGTLVLEDGFSVALADVVALELADDGSTS